MSKKIQIFTTYLLASTGSMYPAQGSHHWHEYVESRIPVSIEDASHTSSRLDVRTPKEYLENIRNILNPPIADLASFFEVSRQAVYKWLAQESSPEPEKLESIRILSSIADTLKASGIKRSGFLLKVKNANGESLFDLLKNKQSYEDHLNMLITEARIMEESYQQSGLAQSSAKPTDDWQSFISIPASREDL